MGCWLDTGNPFGQLSGIVGQQMTVTARSDFPTDHVTFDWDGCGIFGGALGVRVGNGWVSSVTPREEGEVTLVVRFQEISGGEQTLQRSGSVSFRHPPD